MENLIPLAGKQSSLCPCGSAPWDKCILVESQQLHFPPHRRVSFAALVGIRGSCPAEVDSGSASDKGFQPNHFVLVWYKWLVVVSFPSWREPGDTEPLSPNGSVFVLRRDARKQLSPHHRVSTPN